MNEYADLEISLHRHDGGTYAVEFRFSQPDSDADIRLTQGKPALAEFDFAKLRAQANNPSAYGQELAQRLFADPAVASAFAQARASAASLDIPLRLRLLVGPSAPELHALRWETLRDPVDGAPLFTGQNLLFSRYLSSLDWRPVRLRPKGELRALVVIANPADLQEYDLAPVDVPGELSRAQAGLGSIPVTVLPDSAWRASLKDLAACLRQDSFDILYLVCHGALLKDEPWLWLEDEAGNTARTPGGELVTRIKELAQRPRLVVLASCESAKEGAGEALAGLGPRLAEAGVPAVLAMQGKVSMDTVAGFMPAFFEQLQRDGQIDRAAAVARGEVRSRADYWMPALFMRLKSGRIWYVPGFGGPQRDFEKWESLKSYILDGQCTPILGPGLLEPLLSTEKEIALRWAEKHGFPLSPEDQDNLPRVTQYIVTRHDPLYLRMALREDIREDLLRRHTTVLPEELLKANIWSAGQILQAMESVVNRRVAEGLNQPYQRLAELRLPIYLTANRCDPLARALIQAGADPQVRLCPWNNEIPPHKCLYTDDPTPEKPLVYHLFGHLSEPASLVLTEDDYFDYLIGVTSNKDLIPPAVRAALASTALLFLGFGIDDWSFRVFFRTLMAQEGGRQRVYRSHVAAQIEPDEARTLDPERARRFLEKYFEGGKISIYWGAAAEFLADLTHHLNASPSA